MRTRHPAAEQPSLFAAVPARAARPDAPRQNAPSKWRMPEVSGLTVAMLRVRWTKRLTPAQVARVEAELSALPARLTKLGFGPVQVERVFVRRRRA